MTLWNFVKIEGYIEVIFKEIPLAFLLFVGVSLIGAAVSYWVVGFSKWREKIMS